MKSGWTIGKKLAAAFSAMTLIALVMGAFGYYGAVKNRAVIEEVGEVRLPSIDSLLAIKAEAEAIRGAIRSLSIDGLSPEMRKRQYDNIAQSRKDYEAAWKVYEPLPQTPEEAETWKRFVPAWEAWRAENNRLLELHRRFDRLGVQSPLELSRQLERFTKGHHAWVNRVQNLLDDPGAHFDGGDDHTACNAGKYLPSFRTENQALAAAIKAFEEPHRRFHEAVGRVKKLVQEGKPEEGQAVYRREMVPAMQAVFKQFEAMLSVAEEAAATKKEADDLALGEATRKQREAIALLDKLVEINREVAEKESQEGLAQAGFLKGAMLGAVLAGLAVAVILGFWLTRSITGALRRVIAGLSEG
ncbi:MAG: MCP four helix bundle domain-containing protein, partial [Desulfobacterales bacterium]